MSDTSDAEANADIAAADGPPTDDAVTSEVAAPDAVTIDAPPEDDTAQDELQPLVDRRKKAVLGVPIEVVISVGKARPLLSELVGLRRDSVLMLDSKIEDPVEIMVGDRVIARGELQEIDQETGRLCVRLTEVADLSQSL